MIEQLASLLLPLDALLSHKDFELQDSRDLSILYRNMWLICVLFHFLSLESGGGTDMEWQRPALARIAARTPPMISEDTNDSVASDLQYSSVIRQEYAQSVSVPQLKRLFYLTNVTSDYFSAPSPVDQAYIHTGQRHPPPFLRPDHIPVNDA